MTCPGLPAKGIADWRPLMPLGSKIFVRTVARGFFGGLFAVAHHVQAGHGHFEFDGFNTAALVRTVAEGLVPGLAAGARPLNAGLQVEPVRPFCATWGSIVKSRMEIG
jgi:hypothetical protein